MTLRQGKHQKIESLIDDSDVRFACLSFLRKARPETISGNSFAQWVTENLYKHPELSLDHPVNIHRNTAIQWLHNLRFRRAPAQKGEFIQTVTSVQMSLLIGQRDRFVLRTEPFF